MSGGRIVLGLLLVVGGAVWLLDVLEIVDVPPRTLLPVALIAIGAVLLARARRGAHGGLVVAGAVITAILTIGSAVSPPDGSFRAFGDRVVRPLNVASLEDYGAAFGSLTVDLTDLELPPGTTLVRAGVTFGSLLVIVPRDADVEVKVDVTFGDATVFGRRLDDGVTGLSSPGADRRLELDLSASFGDVVVRRGDVERPFGRRGPVSPPSLGEDA